MNPSELLRRRTAETHLELERTGFARRLAAGEIDRTEYADYLRATATLVASLRTDVRRHGIDRQRRFLGALESWTRALEADLVHLGIDDGTANLRAQRASLRLVQQLRFHFAEAPGWIVGIAYVLFGSHNGNRVVADAVTRGLSLAGSAGTRYLRATCDDTSLWPVFKDAVDAALNGEPLVEQAVDGALATFSCFHEIFEALESGGARGPHATGVNPEAGDHPVVTDAAFRTIATRAGTLCHTAFGYLVKRYGDRGEAFARSDGAWLGTLVELADDAASAQVDWLAGLLSARGIPSVCLAYHLDTLHHLLTEHGLLEAGQRDRFDRLARDIDTRIRSAFEPDSHRRLAGTALPALDPRGAEVLLGSVADQQLGLAPCADRIRDWVAVTPLLDDAGREEARGFLDSARDSITT